MERVIRFIFCSVLAVIFMLRSPLAVAQAGDPAAVPNTQQPKHTVSGVVALYTFLRAAAADDVADVDDKARSAAMISSIGLNAADSDIVQRIFSEYAASIRALHDANSPGKSASDLQRGEISAYVHVIQRLRTELSPDGLRQLRNHLEAKKAKMELHMREEVK